LFWRRTKTGHRARFSSNYINCLGTQFDGLGAEARNSLPTEQQQNEIEALAKQENRAATPVGESMLRVYRLRRRLSEYGQVKVQAQGLEAKSQAHAERVVNKAVAESRTERGK
jgi:hypothetical protein